MMIKRSKFLNHKALAVVLLMVLSPLTTLFAQIGNDAPLDPAISDRITDWENAMYQESAVAAAGVDQLIAVVGERAIVAHQELQELNGADETVKQAIEQGDLLHKRTNALVDYLREFRLDRHDPATPVSIGPWLDSCLVYRQLHREIVSKRGVPSRGMRNPAIPYLGTLDEKIAKHTLDLHRNILILQALQAELEGLDVLKKRAATGGKADFVATNTSLNVLYVGVDNPVKIGAEGVSTSTIEVSGMGATADSEPGSFILKPMKPGIDVIQVGGRNLAGSPVTGEVSFRVLPIPLPDLYIGESKGGVLRKQTMQSAEGILVRNSSFPLAYDFTVKTIEVVYTPEYGSTRTIKANGSKFSGEMKDVLRKQIRPNQILLVRATVLMPDGTNKTISSTFRIQ